MAGYGAEKLRLGKSRLSKMTIHMKTERSPLRVVHEHKDGTTQTFPFESAESGGELAQHLMKHIAQDEGAHEGVDGAGDVDDAGEGRLKQGAYRSQGKS